MNETTPLQAWRDISVPALLLCATKTVRPIREIAELLCAAYPDWRYAELSEGGHMAPLTRPDLVNPIIAGFLDEGAGG